MNFDRVSFIQVKVRNTEAKLNFSIHSDFSVETKDKVYKSKVLISVRNVFLGTSYTFPTLSDSTYIYVKHYLLERYFSFFRPIFKNFAVFRTRIKQESAKMFQKRSFLTVYTR